MQCTASKWRLFCDGLGSSWVYPVFILGSIGGWNKAMYDQERVATRLLWSRAVAWLAMMPLLLALAFCWYGSPNRSYRGYIQRVYSTNVFKGCIQSRHGCKLLLCFLLLEFHSEAHLWATSLAISVQEYGLVGVHEAKGIVRMARPACRTPHAT